jgi:hypothetical protein
LRDFSAPLAFANVQLSAKHGQEVKEDTLTSNLAIRTIGRSLTAFALLGAIVALALAALLGTTGSNSNSAPKFGSPIAAKTVSGSPSRRL